MKIKVAKFGGSSLADAAQFSKVKAIVESDSTRLFVVPSAPGRRTYTDKKVTDILYRCQARAAAGELFEEEFDVIAQRYIDIAQELRLRADISKHLQTVWADIRRGASADYAASRGEYLSGLLLAEYIGFEFLDAADFIRFTQEGKFDSELTQSLLQRHVAGKSRVVIPGFYGTLPDGSIKVFPRGGSDITGAIVARGVGADIYENWTDVSGFMMVDPRIVKDAAVMRTLTYSELRELAYMGAGVLHEESVFPVRQACIPIHVRNTNAPEEEGTMILPDAGEKTPGGRLTGIAGRCGFSAVAVAKDNMHNEVGFCCRMLEVFKSLGISFEHMPSGIDALSVILSDTQLEGKRSAVVDGIMAACEPDSVEIHENLALIAVVGRGMVGCVGTAARLFGALARAGVNVRMIDQGSGEMNIIVGVENDDFEPAVRAIYEEFKND